MVQRRGMALAGGSSWRPNRYRSPVGFRSAVACGVSFGAVIFLVLATMSESFAQQGEARPAARAPRPEFQLPEIREGLPNVLSIGDSISIGYLLPLRKELDGVANVFRPPTNCGPTTNGVKSLDEWLSGRKYDVIHFNFGLHDLKYMGPGGKNLADPSLPTSHPQVPIEEYAANLKNIAERLKATGAVVIWRETTPVPKGAQGRVPGDAAKYNEVAAKVIEEVGGILTDPMFEYASREPIASLQLPANVHYSPEGSAALAKKAADSIRAALPSAARPSTN